MPARTHGARAATSSAASQASSRAGDERVAARFHGGRRSCDPAVVTDDDVDIRVLAPGDEAALDAFLAQHADTSMFLRSNARAAGLVDDGEPLHGTYVAAFDAHDEIVAVAAHAWNGMLLVQAPVHLAAVARAAVFASGRALTGFSGAYDQVVAARRALGLADAPAKMSSREVLMALALDDLVVPDARGRVARRATRADAALLADWRAAFSVESLGDVDGPDLRARCRETVDRAIAAGDAWLVDVDGVPSSCAVFNARLPDVVQVGGVFTPRDRRRRGAARAVVAGMLRAARDEEGVGRAILFTEEHNVAAQTAYRAIGFRDVGWYGLVLLA